MEAQMLQLLSSQVWLVIDYFYISYWYIDIFFTYCFIFLIVVVLTYYYFDRLLLLTINEYFTFVIFLNTVMWSFKLLSLSYSGIINIITTSAYFLATSQNSVAILRCRVNEILDDAERSSAAARNVARQSDDEDGWKERWTSHDVEGEVRCRVHSCQIVHWRVERWGTFVSWSVTDWYWLLFFKLIIVIW